MKLALLQLPRRAAGLALALSLVGGVGVTALAKPMLRTRCLNGEVVSLSRKAVTVRYKMGSKIVTKALSLTQKQYDAAIGKNARTGSQVKVCSKDGWKSLAGNVLHRRAAGSDPNAAPGGENAGPGGGGGGGGGS